MKKRSSILSQLILLISVFLFGIFALITLHLIFINLIDDLNKRTDNLKVKIEIGRLIVNDLTKIRSDFYELAVVANNKRGRDIIKNSLDEKIIFIENALNILKNGGELKREIRLNVAGHNSTTIILNYKNESKDNISLEAIDINPKLLQLKDMIDTVEQILDKQNEYKDSPNDYLEFSNQIKRFYRTTPAYFVRMTENANRLLFEGEIELKKLESELKTQISQYEKVELVIIIFIILLVIILGYAIARNINLNAKDLEELNEKLDVQIQKAKRQEISTRAILDAQSNIVVVSDGKEMIDANKALIEFFNGYNNFNDFKKKHACICDYFVDIGSSKFIIDIDYDGKKWFEYVIDNPNNNFKVAMMKDDELNYFNITAQKKIIDEHNFIIIITLNNVTQEVYTQRELKNLNDNLEDIIYEKTRELQELNENLEQRILLEVDKNRKKDKQMIQQSRFAALGEMIGNIAHQWRQPLSAISSTASSMKVQLQLGLSNNDDIEKSYDNITKYVEFLSQTIEDFRGFFKQDKQKCEFNLCEIVKKSLTITNAVYKDTNIMVEESLEKELKANGYPNELSQVFLNILNNAKDILKEKNDPEERFVKIMCHEEKDFNTVTITDNAGGIPNEIIEKIFDPYFTTKHQSQGTGIGLYMSKEIVEKNLKGTINVSNLAITFNNKNYIGASFEVKIPKV